MERSREERSLESLFFFLSFLEVWSGHISSWISLEGKFCLKYITPSIFKLLWSLTNLYFFCERTWTYIAPTSTVQIHFTGTLLDREEITKQTIRASDRHRRSPASDELLPHCDETPNLGRAATDITPHTRQDE
jgi:hypothetical protein